MLMTKTIKGLEHYIKWCQSEQYDEWSKKQLAKGVRQTEKDRARRIAYAERELTKLKNKENN